jgi:hypothetical protein
MAATVEQVNDEITKALEECIPSAGNGMLLALREVVLMSNERSRMGQNIHSANYAPYNLSYHQSDFCGRSSMYAAVLLPLSVTYTERLAGWNLDYQKLALNIAITVMKPALILSMFHFSKASQAVSPPPSVHRCRLLR